MDRAVAMERLGTSSHASRVERIRIQVKDGSLRTFELSEPQSVIYEQEPARMVLARDVTEREALREQLLLADRMSQLGFLAAGVAHEINNPLAYALAAMDRAKEELDAGRIEGAQSSLVIAREGAERVRAITNDLRLFTRGGEPRAEAIDLAGVIRATADLAAANIRTLGRLVLDLRRNPPGARGHRAARTGAHEPALERDRRRRRRRPCDQPDCPARLHRSRGARRGRGRGQRARHPPGGSLADSSSPSSRRRGPARGAASGSPSVIES